MSAVLEAREPGAQYLEALQPALVRQFDLLATASAGAARLRELVLTLAVQGRLVAQDSADEPASAILEQVGQVDRRKKLAGLIQEGTQRPTARADPDREVPGGWICVRGSDLFKLRKGRVPSKLSDAPPGIPYLDIDALDRGLIKRFTSDQNCPTCSVDDILVVCDGSRSGLVLQGKDGAIGSTLAVIETPRPLQAYVKLIFWEGFRRFNSGMKGAAIPHLDTKALFAEVVGLPPLAEQARIVARVDELMRLCDALEAKGRLEAEQHARLLGTLLGTLTDSTTSEELAANWQRVADHFDLLLDRPEAVDALEQVILQLGLRGVLLPSPALDEFPTSDGRQRSLLGDPFAWPTAKLGDVLRDLRYGTSAKCSYAQPGTPVLRIPNLHDGAIDTSDLKFGDLEPKEADNLRLEVGDLLIIRSNGSVGLVGTAALVSSPLPGFAFAGYLVRARLDRAKVVPSFMALVMRSPEVRRQIEGPIRTTSGVKNINSTEIQRISFTLPPLEVQDLIVHTVTELRRLCANLHERLDRCNTVRAALADALIDQALLVA